MVAYYADRAKEYEKIYEKPERQSDLLALTELLQSAFAGENVMEIACGTGYWTQRIAKKANTVLATDINQSVIDIAKAKDYEKNNVLLEIADIFNYSVKNPTDSLFGGFIWSHIKLQDINKFLDTVNGFVKPGGLIVFVDNNYVEGSSLPITSKDEFGNTYQERILENGNKYSVVKNFPDEKGFNELLKERGDRIKFISLKHYWMVSYYYRPLV